MSRTHRQLRDYRGVFDRSGTVDNSPTLHRFFTIEGYHTARLNCWLKVRAFGIQRLDFARRIARDFGEQNRFVVRWRGV